MRQSHSYPILSSHDADAAEHISIRLSSSSTGVTGAFLSRHSWLYRDFDTDIKLAMLHV